MCKNPVFGLFSVESEFSVSGSSVKVNEGQRIHGGRQKRVKSLQCGVVGVDENVITDFAGDAELVQSGLAVTF